MKRSFLFLLVSAVAVVLVGCPDNNDTDPPSTGGNDTTAARPVDHSDLPKFVGRNAYDHIAAQVAFGPRNPNSPGSRKALEYFNAELKQYADTVWNQTFSHTGYDGEQLQLTNVIASFNPSAERRVLLCAHWDTRPRADYDRDPSRQDEPIIGANDGGSGVGVLLELARVMKENPPPIGVDIILFDGEDYGNQAVDDLEQYFLGSKYYARNLPPGPRQEFGILLDLVGDAQARFPKEGHSMEYAAPVVNHVWQAAADLGLKQFVEGGPPYSYISDDHVPLNEIAGIPTIDIIDAELVGQNTSDPRRRYWHSHDDTLTNISTDMLADVGRLLVYVIYRTTSVG